MRGLVVVTNHNATAAIGHESGPDGPPRCPVCGFQLQVGDLSLDLITDIVRRGGKVIELTPLLLRLLKYLMLHAGKTCRRKDILAAVWGYDFKPGSMAFLEVQINRLRAAIDKGFPTRMIETENGVGYRLIDDREESRDPRV